ncbi:hypothetical protein P7K49_017337 [Saguinus oedipus]|uniref:Uncharacterized protein n=1 Tax=Saguinus oedipus TaxID=9490 RepID=A0ABQ9V287_SAGOE|nr:hypothetical protein P7K49_017337 [Saguinus oedipus]
MQASRHPSSPGHPQQCLGGQEGEHTLHHLRQVTQHEGAPWVYGGGAAAVAAATHRLHSSSARRNQTYGGSEGPGFTSTRLPGRRALSRRPHHFRLTEKVGGATRVRPLATGFPVQVLEPLIR